MSPLIAAIYARKSTDQQAVADDQRSVTRQVAHAREYATGKGWTVPDDLVFVDDGISGAEFANRPAFLRLMNALRPRPAFHILIMSEESRLGREAIETAYALKQIVQAGVRVFFYLEDRERTLGSPTDKVLLSLTAFADELERERARQRTYDALMRRAQMGLCAGGRLFGYANVRDESGVRRVIDETEAAVVRRIFELAAHGWGLTSIAKRLNDEGARSPRAQQGRPSGWAPSSVREVLHRSTYRGEVVWNQSQKRDGWGVKHQRPRDSSEWIRLEMPDLAIVPARLWEAAHTAMAAQRARYSGTSPSGAPPWGTDARYLLTGLLRCTTCGGGIEARSRRATVGRVVFYGCSAYHRRGRSVCVNALTVPMENADAAVLSALEVHLLNPRVITTSLDRAVQRIAGRAGTHIDVAAELRVVEQEIARLTEAIAAGGGAIPALVKALQARETRRRELLARRETRREVIDPQAVRVELEQRIEDWRGLIHDRASHGRRLLKQLIVGRLDLTPNHEQRFYQFRGIGTLMPLITGLVPQSVASPPGFDALWYVDLAGRIDRGERQRVAT